MAQRAERSIPLGAQTYSKSKTQFPVGAAPLYLTRGDAAHVSGNLSREGIDRIGAPPPR